MVTGKAAATFGEGNDREARQSQPTLALKSQDIPPGASLNVMPEASSRPDQAGACASQESRRGHGASSRGPAGVLHAQCSMSTSRRLPGRERTG
jgi:hypothetical protein